MPADQDAFEGLSMIASYWRVGAILFALAGCFLLIVNLGEPPRPDRIAAEIVMFVPLLAWLLSRRLHFRH